MILSPFVSCIVIAVIQHAQPSQADNPERNETVQSYRLDFFENGKPYDSARRACEARDAWLVEIKDEEIFDAVYRLKKHYSIWIGAFYSSKWTWNGMGSLRYANWSSGYPSTIKATFKNNCGLMSQNGQWRNQDCTTTQRYVCQTDLNYPGSFSLTFVATPTKTFNDAKAACTAMTASSSRLVEIKTPGLNSFINRSISSYSGQIVQYWTSGNDIVREGEWKWGDGNSINKSSINWITSAGGKREPSGNTNADCLATHITGWADELCSNSNGYICQENITSGHCEEEVCSDRGICEISDKRYICSCNAGYFGTKCEKELITISLSSRFNDSLYKGQNLIVVLTVKSYDGSVIVSYQKGSGSSIANQIEFPIVGSIKTEYSLGIQLENVTYHFNVRPASSSDSYSRSESIDITVNDHCISSPCMNDGTCNYTTSTPYYTCTCKLEYDGPRCGDTFVKKGNCKYFLKNETLNFTDAGKKCAQLSGSLTMMKTHNVTSFLEQEIRNKFGSVGDGLWVGGEQNNNVWFWLDGTKINDTGPLQMWNERTGQYLVVQLRSRNGEMHWISKNESNAVAGYICESYVQNPCESMNCTNGGNCVTVGCQANCNCTPGFNGDLCETDRIRINVDDGTTLITAVQNQSVMVTLRIWSNHGPVKIVVFNESTQPMDTKRNITESATFTIGPMLIQTEGIEYIFRTTPEAAIGSYYRQISVNITVEGPPSVTINGSDVLLIPSKANITVECYASSVPSPSVTWIKDGVELPTEDSKSVYQSKAPNYATLHLVSTARTQVGYYTCYAENEVGEEKRLVLVRGKIHLVENNTVLPESAFEMSTLSCTFEGYPSPNVGWKRDDGKEIPRNESGSVFKWHTIVNMESQLVRKTSTLNISLPEYLGSATVSCYATNAYENSADATFSLNQNLLIQKNRSYRIYADARMTQADAEEYCEKIERSLIKIFNNETQRFIADELSRRNITSDVFIGAKKYYSDGIELWKWHDGEHIYNMMKDDVDLPTRPTTDTTWNGSDANETENCLALQYSEHWSWVPTNCNSKIGFICESKVGGIPTNLEVSVEKCQRSFNFSWTADKQALGVEHKIEVGKENTNSTISTSNEIPQNVLPILNGLENLENASVYDIKITVCPRCPFPSTISTTARMPTLIRAENRRISEANVTRHDRSKSCMISWSPDEPAVGITGFKVTSLVKLVHTASTKGREWSDEKEFEANLSTTQYSVPMHYNRNYTFSIQIMTCLDSGESKYVYGGCIADRGPPTFVPKPVITTTENSDGKATVQISYPDETNGPISCLFIITTGTLSDSNGTIFGMNELFKASENSKSETHDPSSPHVSIAISRSEIADAIEGEETFITRILGEGSTVSSCDITADDYSRKKRDVPETTAIEGRNRKLSAGESFSIFIVSTTPGDNGEVFVKTSRPTMSSVLLPSSSGAMVAGIVIAIIATVALAVVTAVLVKRKHDSSKRKSFTITMPQVEEEEQQEEHAYANFGFNNREPKSETEISIDQLKPIYNSMKSRNSEDFREEFHKLKEDAKSLTYPTQVASAASVTMKNRYRNILPSDRSRVVLKGEGDSTYINACYINGYSKNKKFIAAQGPLPNTVNDFWRMVSEQKCAVIVMLANCVENGRIKCEKYWPDRGVLKFYGNVNVSNVKETSFGGYKIREFHLTKDDKKITVHQYHFLSWPDHGAPVTTTNLIRFYNAVVKHQMKSAPDSPIVVHCSAGAGRTGTFIAYDYLLEQKEATSYIDIYGCVMNLRGQRVDMVQTCDQYILLHKLMLENCLLGETDMDATSFDDLIKRDSEGRNKLWRQFDKLSLVGPVNQMKHGDVPRNRAMNRNGDTVPYENNRVIILKQIDEMDVPYLNASTIETYGSFIKLFAAQGPMKSSVEYFWRSVIDNGVTTIVMLTLTMENKKEQCFQYWPESSDKDVLVKDIVVHLESESADESITEREFTVFRGDDRRTVKQYQYLQWTSEKCPDNPGIVLDLVKKVSENPANKIGDGTIVHCSDGAGRTGAFCTILNLIGRLKSENKIDIFRTVKDLRDCRPGMVQTYEYLLFCHLAVSAYMKTTNDE